MRLLVFGQTGQLARELAKAAPEARFLGRSEADFLHPDACAQMVRDCDAVINAAAWTAVDAAEANEPQAMLVNATTPGKIARACAAQKIPFLHVSTDYVFNGSGNQPHQPTDPAAPLSAYGRTKAAGETLIRAASGKHLILRTSWVVSAHGANFVKTMLRLGRERPALNVVHDQHGAPTPAAALAQALLTAARALHQGAPGGTHHFAGTPDTTWADFAREIMAQANLPCTIHGIPTTDYPTPAQRPLNSRLDCTSFTTAFGVPRPDWRAHLALILKDLNA